MTKYFNKFKNSTFWPIFGKIFPILGGKYIFQKIWLSHTTQFLESCQNLEKINIIPIKFPNKQKDRSYIIGPLQQLLGIQQGNIKCMLSKFPMYLKGNLPNVVAITFS